jgi:hypothetical protein
MVTNMMQLQTISIAGKIMKLMNTSGGTTMQKVEWESKEGAKYQVH